MKKTIISFLSNNEYYRFGLFVLQKKKKHKQNKSTRNGNHDQYICIFYCLGIVGDTIERAIKLEMIEIDNFVNHAMHLNFFGFGFFSIHCNLTIDDCISVLLQLLFLCQVAIIFYCH